MSDIPEVEVVEATPAQADEIAANCLEKAAKSLREGDRDHAALWIYDAKIWARLP